MTVGDTRPGYVLFMRREKNIDQAQYRIYHDKAYLPFIDQLRQEYDSWDGNVSAIQSHMQSVGWRDRDLPQIAEITDDAEPYVVKKIVCNRHNPARLLLSACADLAAEEHSACPTASATLAYPSVPAGSEYVLCSVDENPERLGASEPDARRANGNSNSGPAAATTSGTSSG